MTLSIIAHRIIIFWVLLKDRWRDLISSVKSFYESIISFIKELSVIEILLYFLIGFFLIWLSIKILELLLPLIFNFLASIASKIAAVILIFYTSFKNKFGKKIISKKTSNKILNSIGGMWGVTVLTSIIIGSLFIFLIGMFLAIFLLITYDLFLIVKKKE